MISKNFVGMNWFQIIIYSKIITISHDGSKCDLMHELEQIISPKDNDMSRSESMSVIVDTMIICRKVDWNNCTNFGSFAEKFCSIVSLNQRYSSIERIDFVFDDYFEKSLK